MTAAEEGSERVDTDKSRRDIGSEIRQLKQHISQDQPSLEEQEEVQKAYTDAMDKYVKHSDTHRDLETALKVLKEIFFSSMLYSSSVGVKNKQKKEAQWVLEA